MEDWQHLTKLTQGEPILVERVRMAQHGIAIEGQFELPQLARLPLEDQVFIIAFVRSHGSIKEMEQVFGVSYPTIKARLTRIANSLEFVEYGSNLESPLEPPTDGPVECGRRDGESEGGVLARC